MDLWYCEDTRKVAGAHQNLQGKLDAISGDCTNVWGYSLIRGNVTALRGCLTGLSGFCRGLHGDVSHLRGDISGIRGRVNGRLIGDVSGLRGDISHVWGKADHLHGGVDKLLDQGLLWPKDSPLTLEMFASRYNLPMEFFDNSGAPALIGFYALEDLNTHWVSVRDSSSEGFAVGPLSSIHRLFPGEEVIKVAVPSDANWQLLEGFELLRTDKIYAFEQVGASVQTASD